jgi:uncharacterized DUF497 family protein
VRISSFIWLESVVEKIEQKHGVSSEEAESVFTFAPTFRFVEKGHRTGENLYVALGPSSAGRYLAAFFVYKSAGRALMISVRDMDASERKLYGQR